MPIELERASRWLDRQDKNPLDLPQDDPIRMLYELVQMLHGTR